MITLWLAVGVLAASQQAITPVGGESITFEQAQRQFDKSRRESIDSLVDSLEPERPAKRKNKKTVVVDRYPANPVEPTAIPVAGQIDLSAAKQAGEDADRAILISGRIRTTVIQAVEDEAAIALLLMMLEGK